MNHNDMNPEELDQRVAKLPQWASLYINHLRYDVKTLRSGLNALQKGAMEGPISLEAYDIGPDLKGQFYLPGHNVTINHRGVVLRVLAAHDSLRLSFEVDRDQPRTWHERVSLIPVSGNTIHFERVKPTWEDKK